MSQRNHTKMNQEFFTNLPSEIIIDILSRLQVRHVISCKCVCKSWLCLIETHEFAKSHLSKSVPGLAIHDSGDSELYRIFEFVDEIDLEHHELHYNLVTEFNLPFYGWMDSSANGLIFLRDLGPYDLHICNPITRDYVKFHCPKELVHSTPEAVTYGFGVSKTSDQHKVVGIFQDCLGHQEKQELPRIPKSECHVYTLGTGSWRRIAPGGPLIYGRHTTAAFLVGYLHWLVFDLSGCPWISCFDIETELFTTFSSPTLPGSRGSDAGLFALGDSLCLCDNTSHDEIVIWLMKEYGVENSWTKDFIISKAPNFAFSSAIVCPLKVFKDGDILMAWGDDFLFCYSKKNKTMQRIMFDLVASLGVVRHTPSFLSLKRFEMENVKFYASQNANI